MTDQGAQPEGEMCEHCSSWGEGSSYCCHTCGLVWPEGKEGCPRKWAADRPEGTRPDEYEWEDP
jgi:hypothetical protein